MKSVLISTQPKWCEKICRKIGEQNGIPVYLKPVEVRKSAPKEVPFKAYIYCTNNCFDISDVDHFGDGVRIASEGRGKVIGEFVCDNIVRYPYALDTYWIRSDELDKTCLCFRELKDYGKGKPLYGWRISNLKIYDKPKELSEFRKPCPYKNLPCWKCPSCDLDEEDNLMQCFNTISRAPQSWCYVEEI